MGRQDVPLVSCARRARVVDHQSPAMERMLLHSSPSLACAHNRCIPSRLGRVVADSGLSRQPPGSPRVLSMSSSTSMQQCSSCIFWPTVLLLASLLVTSAAAGVLSLLSSHACSTVPVSLTLLRSRVSSWASPRTSRLSPDGASRMTLGILASSSITGCPSLTTHICQQLSLVTSRGLSLVLLVGLAALMVLG